MRPKDVTTEKCTVCGELVELCAYGIDEDGEVEPYCKECYFKETGEVF